MSGICGLFNLDQSPAAADNIGAMCAMLERRAPDGTSTWRESCVALGHTQLITTPEAALEQQPVRHAESGCVITADARLDNRDEILAALAFGKDKQVVSDAELLLHAYLAWGSRCVERLLGDFAFAIWDPRHRHLVCARDHFGMRPFYYHYSPVRRFLFGSSAASILVVPDVPYNINEARVADYLIQELEWVDYTCSFFDGVARLPPGHRALVNADRVQIEAYWQPEATPDPGPLSDDDWREGLLEHLTRSVDRRLRAPTGQVGSMLSGGMDSGSVVAIAKDLLHDRGASDLPTYSAVCGTAEIAEESACIESQAIYATVALPRINPTLIVPEASLDDMPQMLYGYEEPFDTGFMFLKKIYAEAANQGMRVVLDGGGGDVVLGDGSYIVRLIRAGHWSRAWAEITAENRYYGDGRLATILGRYARAVMLPEFVKRSARRLLGPRIAKKKIRESLVSADLARHVNLADRFQRMRQTFENDRTGDYAMETMRSILPNMTAGKERYARLAASCATEARDPFMDKRLVEFCAHIPGHLRILQHQYKLILRQVMDGRVPKDVAWGDRKPHIGWLFNQAVKNRLLAEGRLSPQQLQSELGDWLDEDVLARSWREFQHYGYCEEINTALCLALWLEEHRQRPQSPK